MSSHLLFPVWETNSWTPPPHTDHPTLTPALCHWPLTPISSVRSVGVESRFLGASNMGWGGQFSSFKRKNYKYVTNLCFKMLWLQGRGQVAILEYSVHLRKHRTFICYWLLTVKTWRQNKDGERGRNPAPSLFYMFVLTWMERPPLESLISSIVQGHVYDVELK